MGSRYIELSIEPARDVPEDPEPLIEELWALIDNVADPVLENHAAHEIECGEVLRSPCRFRRDGAIDRDPSLTGCAKRKSRIGNSGLPNGGLQQPTIQTPR